MLITVLITLLIEMKLKLVSNNNDYNGLEININANQQNDIIEEKYVIIAIHLSFIWTVIQIYGHDSDININVNDCTVTNKITLAPLILTLN